MQFESFHWLSHHSLVLSHDYTMLYEYGERTRDFLGRFLVVFGLICYIFGAFLIKQFFQSRLLCEMT